MRLWGLAETYLVPGVPGERAGVRLGLRRLQTLLLRINVNLAMTKWVSWPFLSAIPTMPTLSRNGDQINATG